MKKKKLLVIGYTWPEPSTTAAGNRMLQLLRFFLAQDYQITFSSTAASSDKSLDLEEIKIKNVSIHLNHPSFNVFVADLKPDVVLFDRFLTEEQFGWRVAEFAPNALRILDTEDLHSLRSAREKAVKKGSDFTTEFWLQQDMTIRELSSCHRSDLVLIISSYEMHLLKNSARMFDTVLMHLPFMVDPLSEAEIKGLKPYGKRKDFICIGNGKHAPNLDAITWLKKEVWPLIRMQLPEVKVHIYGAYLPERIRQLQNKKEGFLVHGWAENVKNVMESARVNLAPLRFGAGLKGKLIDAMQNGTPSVTTSIGAEGMCDHSLFNGLIADEPKTFADRCVELFLNENIWVAKQTNGFQGIRSNFDKVELEKRLYAKIEATRENLKKHRIKNIIGRLLMYQTMASTKYMSKWIEEKNKG